MLHQKLTDRTMISVDEISTRWGVSPDIVYEAIQSGQLRSVTLGQGYVRIPLIDVIRVESANESEQESQG